MAIASPQQLNMADRIAVRRNVVARSTAIVTNFALYILGESAGAGNHANRLVWAKAALASPDEFGDRLSWYVINQPSFLNGGSAIDDTELQGVIESAIAANFIPSA